MLEFGLLEGLLGRRSRRFFMGAEIPDGVFAYKSKHAAVPLSEIEKLLVVSACGGGTSWHHMRSIGRCAMRLISPTTPGLPEAAPFLRQPVFTRA